MSGLAIAIAILRDLPVRSRCALARSSVFLLMDISIIGSGYVGLVTGACFADVGHNVICVDNDPRKVEALQAGKVPIYEPGLEEVIHRNVSAQRLRFTGSIKEGVDNSQIVFIAVPTPQQPDGSVDLSFIEKVAREIAGVLTDYRVIVDKSTVPVKTGEKVAESIKRYNRHGAKFDVVSNPEFLARRLRRRRPDASRPDRDRRAKRACDRSDEEGLRAVHGADSRDRHQQRRVDQACRQFIPRAENFLHQRGLRDLRSERRGRGESRGRHRHGSPNRPEFSQRRHRLWRILFPERHRRVHHDQRAAGRAVHFAEGSAAHQRDAKGSLS